MSPEIPLPTLRWILPSALRRPHPSADLALLTLLQFNLYADPYAGAHIFKASFAASHPFQLQILPLDITTPHVVHFKHLLPASPPTTPSILSDYKTAFLTRVRTIYSNLGLGDGMEMHDPMVSSCSQRPHYIRTTLTRLARLDPFRLSGTPSVSQVTRPLLGLRPGSGCLRLSERESGRGACVSSTGGPSLFFQF